MFIFAGLGNPGPRYARNRHNVGFMAADAIHGRYRFAPWRQKFQAEIAEGDIGGERSLLVKPLTYMNESGRAVGEVLRFYKAVPADLVVAHDELDLAPGRFRTKTGGGHGGHNGLRSITSHIGDAYRRLRIGIGHPGDKALVHTWVLHDFAKAEDAWLDPLLAAIAEYAPLLAKGDDATFANRVHLAVTPAKPRPPARDAAAGAPSAGTPKGAGGASPAATPVGDAPSGGSAKPEPSGRGPSAPATALGEKLARLLGRN